MINFFQQNQRIKMKKLEEILNYAKINLYLIIVSVAFTWSLVFLKPEWMYIWVYYSDPENWLKDSSSYLIVGMSFLLPGMLLLFAQLIKSTINKEFMLFLGLVLILTVAYFFFDYLAKKVLVQEVRQINYERYLKNAKTDDREAKKIASMLENDCMITILELNQDMFGFYQWQINKMPKIQLNECKNSTQAKSNLINFLQKRQIIQEHGR